MKDSPSPRTARLAILFCLVLAPPALAACGSDSTNGAGSAAPTSRTAPAASPGTEPAKAALPDGLPSDVPLPEDVVLVSATTTSNGGYVIQYMFASPSEQTIADYRDAVASAGYAVPKGAGVFKAAGEDWTIETIKFFSSGWPEDSGLVVRVTPS